MKSKNPIYYTIREALNSASEIGICVTIPTITSWVKNNNLGLQINGTGGQWFVDKIKFDNFLRGIK